MLKKTILVIPATVLLLSVVQSLIAQPTDKGSGDKLNKDKSVALHRLRVIINIVANVLADIWVWFDSTKRDDA